MKVKINGSFSYSTNGNDVINLNAGEHDIPEKFIGGLEARGLIEKAIQPNKNKAKKGYKNKAK